MAYASRYLSGRFWACMGSRFDDNGLGYVQVWLFLTLSLFGVLYGLKSTLACELACLTDGRICQIAKSDKSTNYFVVGECKIVLPNRAYFLHVGCTVGLGSQLPSGDRC